MACYLLITAALLASSSVSAGPITITKNSSPTLVPDGRIVGGAAAAIETFPYQVSLRYHGLHKCGASIISPKFILTAGHCADHPADTYSVHSGTTHLYKGGSIHQVTKVIKHQYFYLDIVGVPHNDIALMEVIEPFEFGSTQQPIELFNATEKSLEGTRATISGWGSVGVYEDPPESLRSVEVPIISQKLCDEAYERYGGLPDGQICAALLGEGGKDSCNGDSGGPMAINGRLAGVISWGYGCGIPDYPGVYTEVAYYREWIEKTIRSRQLDF